MKKGFVISWFYPPGNSSEGLVTYKLLSNSKNTYDVWTKKNYEKDIWDRQVDEKELSSNNVHVIQHENSNREKWRQNAVKYFIEHKDEYDFIMSRILPEDAHEIALEIKRQCPEIKWIASFGDPIVDSPYIEKKKKTGNPYFLREYIIKENLSLAKAAKVFLSPTRLAKKYIWNKECQDSWIVSEKFEKLNDDVFKNADIILLNNEFQYKRAFSPKKYQKYKEKGVVVNHSFDKRLYPQKKQDGQNKKIKFVYTGHLDELRNAKALLRAIEKMKKNDSDLSDKVEFHFFGHVGAKDREFIFGHEIDDLVRIHKDITYKESLLQAINADWNLLIDANFNGVLDEYIYFPAKLADYLGAQNNIFAITQLKGAAASILSKTKGGIVVTHSAENILLYLSKIIYQNYVPEPFNKKVITQYDAINVSKNFDQTVEELVNGKN